MKNISLLGLWRPLRQFWTIIERYHVTIIIVIITGTLIGVVMNVNTILSQPADEDYRATTKQSSLQTRFDQATIDSVNQLRQRQDTNGFALPAGRINPFAE